MQVVVLGTHRSGTSAVARVLNLMGLYFGAEDALTGRNPENPKGFWERRDVRDVNDVVLHHAGCDWDCVAQLDAESLLKSVSAKHQSIVADIVMGMDAHRPWFIKEPRLCVLLPIWKSTLETPICLHVVRNPLETAYSLQARNGIGIDVGLALWEVYNARALEASCRLPRLFLSYEDLMADPSSTVRTLHAALVREGGYDLRLPSDRELDRFLDASLHRQHSSEHSLRSFATPSQLALYRALGNAEGGAEVVAPAPSEGALEALRQYERGIDIEARAQRASNLRQERSQSNLQLQLALRSLEVKHQLASKQEVAKRSAKIESECRELVRQQREAEKTILQRDHALDRLRTELEQAASARSEVEREVERLRTELEQAASARSEVEREVERLRTELERTASARSEAERDVERLRTELEQAASARSEVEREVERLRTELEQAASARSEVEREVERLRTELERAASARSEAEKAILQRDHALDRLRTELERAASVGRDRERSIAKLAGHRSRLRQSIEGVARQAAVRRAEIKRYTTQLEVELKVRRARLASEKELAGQVRDGIEALLGSRRWRIGNALVSLLSLALLRRRLTAKELLHRIVVKHEARLDATRQLNAAAERLTGDLSRYLPDQTQAAAQLVKSSVERSRRLTRMSLERTLAAARFHADVTNAIAYFNDLKEIAELVRHSKRWRLGHFLFSLPHRLLLRPAPATAADSISAWLSEYREPTTPLDALLAPIEPPPSLPPSSAPRKDSPPASRTDVEPAAPFASTSVDVVVCVHNALDDTRRCLASVRAKSSIDHRLIVVNDGSDEETTTVLRELTAKGDVATLIETHGPLGYTHAANAGLRASTAPFVVLLNSDTVVSRLWLEDMLECMSSDDRIGIVGPLSNAASWQSVPERSGSEGGWVVNQLPAGHAVDEVGELIHLWSARRFPRVDFVNGFCLMIRRQVIDRVGYFDDVAFPSGYGEEDDYCLRARGAGFALAIADQGFVYHAKSKSFGSAARTNLVRQGAAALHRKHGREAIAQSTQRLKKSDHLEPIRSALRAYWGAEVDSVACSHRQAMQRCKPHGLENRGDGKNRKVLFLLPVRGGSGGAHSVVQEVLGMRALGVDAKVATRARHAEEFSRFYSGEMQDDDWAVFYSTEEELHDKAAAFDVVVSTIWTSVALLAPIAARWPDKLYVYYVQDYEPWFYEPGTEYRKGAAQSYTLLPNMVLMAKTDWICRTVREHHGVEVFRVAPSLDHDVYYPAEEPRVGGGIVVAAMIRPSTPRRAPLRTLRVLRRVVEQSASSVRIVLFGCGTQDLRRHIAHEAPDFKLDFPFRNHGVLVRREVADVLRSADVFVDFSDYQAFGRTGLEAMACGCATVLPAKGGVHEYAVDGDNARIVATQSIDEMASAVQELIDDSALRERMRRSALQTARRYSILRAALSELSVFRLAKSIAARDEQQNALRPESYRCAAHMPT